MTRSSPGNGVSCAAVEEVGDVRVFLGLGDAELPSSGARDHLAQRVRQRFRREQRREPGGEVAPVLLCTSPGRFYLRNLEPFLPRVVVISPSEIPPTTQVKSMGAVRSREAFQPFQLMRSAHDAAGTRIQIELSSAERQRRTGDAGIAGGVLYCRPHPRADAAQRATGRPGKRRRDRPARSQPVL